MKTKIQLISLLLLTAFTLSLSQKGHTDKSIAKVTYLVGEVKEKKSRQRLKIESPIYAGAKIQTGRESICELKLNDNSIVRIGEKSVYDVMPPKEKESTSFFGSLGLGKIWVKLKKLVGRDSYAIKSPNSVISVRGTTFSVDIAKNKSGKVNVFEGRVDAGTHWILENDSLFDAWIRQDEAAYKQWLEANDPDIWVRNLEEEYADAINKMLEEEKAFYDQEALDYENFLRQEQGLPPIVPKKHGPISETGEGGWISFVKENQTLSFAGDSDEHTVSAISEAVEEDAWTKFNKERDAKED